MKGYIFPANPGGRTSMSAHVVDGARWGISENAESVASAESAGIFAIFREIRRCVSALSRVGGFLTNSATPLWKSMSPTRKFGALSNEKGTYFARILADVHPCLHMSSRAPGGDIGGLGKCGNYRDFRNPWGGLRVVLALSRGICNDFPGPPLGKSISHHAIWCVIE